MPADRARLALHYQELGFRAMKLRLHNEEIAEDLAILDACLPQGDAGRDALHGGCESGHQPAMPAPRVTPVFSPYSGRVLRLIAKLGDVVKKGAPLMTIEAAEFVQGQSDVATAKANLELARDRKAPARPVRCRRRGAQGLAPGPGRSGRGAGRPRGGARPAAHPRQDARRKSTPSRKAPRRRRQPWSPRRSPAPSRSARSASASTSRAPAGGAQRRNSPSATCPPSGWSPMCARGDAPALRVGQPVDVSVLALPGKTFQRRRSPGSAPRSTRPPIACRCAPRCRTRRLN